MYMAVGKPLNQFVNKLIKFFQTPVFILVQSIGLLNFIKDYDLSANRQREDSPRIFPEASAVNESPDVIDAVRLLRPPLPIGEATERALRPLILQNPILSADKCFEALRLFLRTERDEERGNALVEAIPSLLKAR